MRCLGITVSQMKLTFILEGFLVVCASSLLGTCIGVGMGALITL